MKVDAHQHFWLYDPIRDAWIDDSMQVIRRDFTPEDLRPLLYSSGIDGCIAVQADQSEVETAYLLRLAEQNSFIKGVVGWVDLLAEDLEARLSHFSQNSFFRGVRHIAQGEADDYLSRRDVRDGIAQLESFGLTYDLLVFAHQLPAAIDLVSKLPYQNFVLDHIAKPKISKGIDQNWSSNIKALATFPNVFCKVSGMVTETTDFTYCRSDFAPFMEVIFEQFGCGRVMYGSDWPVCLVAAKYQDQIAIVTDYISTFSDNEQAAIMGGNAIDFYNLTIDEIK